MGYNKVDFKALKSRVGIDDIALSLGYKLDRKAGLGRFVELVLPDGQGGKRDTIVISHPNDKQRQTYFRRSDGRNGDVIAFIIENQHSFGISGRNQWDVVSKVMSKFANEPLPENNESVAIRGTSAQTKFNPDNYEVQSVAENLRGPQYIFDQRKITAETVKDFAPWLVRIRSIQSKNNFYNVGFPYRQPGSDKVEGYEIRGVGSFKSKALGTNSTTAAWIVDFTNGNPSEVKNVFFAESAFDVMAMYQANKVKLQSTGQLENSVFVSIGGAFSKNQITGIMNHYSNARAVDCFDNDLTGKIYGLKMVDAVECLGITVAQVGGKVKVGYKGKEHEFSADSLSLNDLRGFVKFKRGYGMYKAPSNFKDWNDVIMNKPLERKLPSTKYDRNENLERKRNSGLKM